METLTNIYTFKIELRYKKPLAYSYTKGFRFI